jgi:hypothetical protein
MVNFLPVTVIYHDQTEVRFGTRHPPFYRRNSLQTRNTARARIIGIFLARVSSAVYISLDL